MKKQLMFFIQGDIESPLYHTIHINVHDLIIGIDKIWAKLRKRVYITSSVLLL